MTWNVTILTLFPQMFPGPLGFSLAGKALEKNIWNYQTVDLRRFGLGRHRNVDDTPFGGGSGMVMRCDVLDTAYQEMNPTPDIPVIYFTPRGRPLKQKDVISFSQKKSLIILCGHYEGIDERFLQKYPIEEISVGDYVLSGGEMASFIFLDACVRLLPGVMGNEKSKIEESFSTSLLEYPQYTRPSKWEGREVPPVLLSGNHKMINAWRKDMSEQVTKNRRPDLWRSWLARNG